MNDLLPSVIKAFDDRDSKVQLAALDSLYNIIKICRQSILYYKDFNKILKEVLNLVASVTAEVREWATKVNDKLVEIVYQALNEQNHDFNLDELVL